jgi:hypothetical protein
MRIQKTAVQAAAVKLTERAEECFERADDQHKSAEAQHANADIQQDNAAKLEVLGAKLLDDATKLFSETEVHPGPAARMVPLATALALPVRPNLAA